MNNGKNKLVRKKSINHKTIINVGGVVIGGEKLTIMAGPCAVENRDLLLTTAQAVKKAGALIIRGGAFKPRTNPYSFQGLGKKGLELLQEVRQSLDIPIITEVMDTRTVDLVAEYSDILQVGTRNMQNFSLLVELGKIDKPVLLKRGMMATISDTLDAAEYILAGGNSQVMICERGIRTFEPYTRNTLDISAIVAMKELTHLPIIVDPSHAVGRREMIPSLLKAAIVAGADGALIDVHCKPSEALCDGDQAMSIEAFSEVMSDLRPLAQIIGRKL